MQLRGCGPASRAFVLAACAPAAASAVHPITQGLGQPRGMSWCSDVSQIVVSEGCVSLSKLRWSLAGDWQMVCGSGEQGLRSCSVFSIAVEDNTILQTPVSLLLWACFCQCCFVCTLILWRERRL